MQPLESTHEDELDAIDGVNAAAEAAVDSALLADAARSAPTKTIMLLPAGADVFRFFRRLSAPPDTGDEAAEENRRRLRVDPKTNAGEWIQDTHW